MDDLFQHSTVLGDLVMGRRRDGTYNDKYDDNITGQWNDYFIKHSCTGRFYVLKFLKSTKSNSDNRLLLESSTDIRSEKGQLSWPGRPFLQ